MQNSHGAAPQQAALPRGSAYRGWRPVPAPILRHRTHLLETFLAPVKEIFDLHGLLRMLEPQERHGNRGKENAEV
ncbi:hypothetical protein GCM10009799_27740 [Nocardiopsis rhodophaea]|uniref:Uncharacterized protein n=1 Tax=Nocardiopsis rhodophaea TaxID=280238 RepID=A0ABN2T584_9ACTN